MIGTKINGIEYFPATELISELSVSRQTFWRWRKQGKIPAGNRFRNGKILFTAAEVETIRQFAKRIEPLDQPRARQLKLFNSRYFKEDLNEGLED